MACNCIEKGTAKIKEEFEKKYQLEGKIECVELQTTLIRDGSNLIVATYSDVEIKVRDHRKKIKTVLVHSFCPVCGIKKKFTNKLSIYLKEKKWLLKPNC